MPFFTTPTRPNLEATNGETQQQVAIRLVFPVLLLFKGGGTGGDGGECWSDTSIGSKPNCAVESGISRGFVLVLFFFERAELLQGMRGKGARRRVIRCVGFGGVVGHA